ncbi:uncharacterized protein LOC105862530 [Microcebus murinus]|uniref:uncharacterized protein LOC105862530 n=1 Tax=Microcebus murinus TaxID=30608 RepID=UPI003F6AA608
MESGEVASAGAGLSQAAQPPQGALIASPDPHAMLAVVVEVEPGKGSGPEETGHPTLLLEGPTNVCLLQPGTRETQKQSFTFDRVLGPDAAQEAEQELLARVQSALGSVGRGYSVALLLRGRETETPRRVPQLLQALFEEALPLGRSDHVLSTLSLVQLGRSGRTQDLLSPGVENLSVLDVPPLGLVVEDASEVEVSDSRAASELYLQATRGDGRACCLLTLTMICPRPDPPQGPEVRGVWRGALRILQLPGAPDCPLLRVLAGEAAGEEVEGSLPWIISWLLEGNNYSGLLLHLDPQGISLSLLQAALLGASGRRMEVKQVRPTLWDAVEEARACRAGLRTLRLSLLGDNLTDNGLSRLGRALRELQVVKAWSQCPRSQVLKGARDEGLPEPQQVTDSAASHSSGLQGELQVAGRTASLRPGLHQKNTHRDSEEQAQQVPDMALQFFLAQARRQRLREQHKIWIGEKLKHLEQEEEVAGDQVKGLEEACEERQRWHQEQTVLRLQLEALEAQRDAAEQDLAVLYDLHVQATRARTCHMLQVFRAWQRLWKEQAMTTEHQHRSLLAGILQDTINLATQNQELQAQNQQLRQGAD